MTQYTMILTDQTDPDNRLRQIIKRTEHATLLGAIGELREFTRSMCIMYATPFIAELYHTNTQTYTHKLHSVTARQLGMVVSFPNVQ
jgi:hypothetical protein